jgi:tRNASer (uridine44-2'-O)-methyltransferase
VYLLVKEGYSGYGFDLRARKSWALWGPDTPLQTTTLSPIDFCLAPDDASPFPSGSFLIGNHCDELTPWIPLLAALTPASGFINIPCCFHTFDGRFTKGNHVFPPELLQDPVAKEDYERSEALQLEKGGRYNAFMSYIAEITVRAGWRLEREALRIPSTKCWAFVGRNRTYGPEDVEKSDDVGGWIREIANEAKNAWKPRKPEGKDH